MAKKFAIPFAQAGDKAAVPDALQPDGSVSYTAGFGPDYELDKDVDPVNAKDVPRDQTNQLFNDLTGAVGEVQLLGYAEWSADLSPYPLNARTYLADKVWRSTVAVNNGTPGVDPEWEDVSENAENLLDSVRVNVASASTVDLVALAPDTRYIQITGDATINSFVIGNGQKYFVSFSGSPTLTNGASLDTNTGQNIGITPGESCVIAATADNTVEILFYNRALLTHTSAQSAMTLGGEIVVANPLGVVPTDIDHDLVCVTSEAGWSPGDVVTQNFHDGYGGIGFIITSQSASEIRIRVASTRVPYVLNKTSGASAAITLANWRYRMRLRRI